MRCCRRQTTVEFERLVICKQFARHEDRSTAMRDLSTMQSIPRQALPKVLPRQLTKTPGR